MLVQERMKLMTSRSRLCAERFATARVESDSTVSVRSNTERSIRAGPDTGNLSTMHASALALYLT